MRLLRPKGTLTIIDGKEYKEEELCDNCGQEPRARDAHGLCVRCYVESKL